MATPSYGAVSVGNTATLIVAAAPDRKGTIFVNNGSVAVYIGMNSSVTTANGMPIAAGGSFTDTGFEESFRGDIYGIVASGSSDVRYWYWQ